MSRGIPSRSGIEKGDRLAVWMLNSQRLHGTLLGHGDRSHRDRTINTRWNNADVDFTLLDSDAKALVVDDAFACRIGELKQAPLVLTKPEYSDAPVSFNEPDEEDLVGLFYTSGHHRWSQGSHADS